MRMTGMVLLIGLTTGAVHADSKATASLEGNETVHSLAWLPDGHSLLAATGHGHVLHVRASDLSLLRRFGTGHAPADAVDVQPDGAGFAVSFADGSLRGYGIDRESPRWDIGGLAAVSRVAFAPDGTLLAAVVSPAHNHRLNGVSLYGVRNQAVKKVLVPLVDARKYVASNLAWSADGRYLAVAVSNSAAGPVPPRNGSQGAEIIDVVSGKKLRRIRHAMDLTAVAFSPDGRTLFAGSTDGRLHAWSLPDGRWLRSFDWGQGIVQTLSLSPDGRLLAGAGMGSGVTAKVWDAASGQLRQSLGSSNPGVNQIAFSPDGRFLAVGLSTHGSARVPILQVFAVR